MPDAAGDPFERMISRAPKKDGGAPPLLFIHGAFAGAWCWDEYFLPWFAEAGWTAHALDLPGRRGHADFVKLQEFGVTDYLDAVLDAVDAMLTPPVLIGHSMGGYLAWQAAERRRLAGLVLMAPVPPTGLAAPAMQLAITNPNLFAEVAEVHMSGTSANAVETLHAAIFSDAVPKDVAERYVPKFQMESQLAVAGLYAMTMPNLLALWGTPIHVIGAGNDPLIPPAQVHWTAALAGRMANIYQGMGHGMMLETGWQKVADDIAKWLKGEGLGPK